METTVVIVLRTNIDNQEITVGIVVDAVSDVYKLEEKNVRDVPNFGSNIDNRFIKGVATITDKVVILLDSETLLDAEQFFNVTQQANAV